MSRQSGQHSVSITRDWLLAGTQLRTLRTISFSPGLSSPHTTSQDLTCIYHACSLSICFFSRSFWRSFHWKNIDVLLLELVLFLPKVYRLLSSFSRSKSSCSQSVSRVRANFLLPKVSGFPQQGLASLHVLNLSWTLNMTCCQMPWCVPYQRVSRFSGNLRLEDSCWRLPVFVQQDKTFPKGLNLPSM